MVRRAVAALALACLAVSAWLFVAPRAPRGGHAAPEAEPAPRESTLAVPPAATGLEGGREVAPPEPLTPDALLAGTPLRPPELAPASSLAVRAKDEDGEPLPDVELVLEPELGPHEAGLAPALAHHAPRRATTGPEGWSLVSNLEPGPWRVRARHPSGLARTLSTALAPGANRLEFELQPAAEALVVRVLAEGTPVPDARVEVIGHWLDAEGRPGLVGLDGPAPTAESGPDGRARFPARRLERGLVLARAPDGRVGSWSGGSRDSLDVRLAPAATLSGRLVGLPPEELSAARVLVRLASTHHPHYTTYQTTRAAPVAADGTFRLEGLPAGQHGIGLEDPRGARLVLPAMDGLANSVAPLVVELVAGETTTRELAVTRGARLTGRVSDAQGLALAGVRVRATLAPRTANFPDGFELHGVNVWRFDADGALAGDHPETHRTAVSGADGGWTLPGLHPGRWRLELGAPGRAYVRESVPLAERETRALEHRLARAGALEGVDRRGGGYLGVRREEAPRPLAIAVLPHSGGFAFTGLEPGRYELVRFHSDEGVAPVPLTTVEVRAGETTWVDLASVPRPIELRGRVSAEGLPVAGARVVVWPEERTTDAAGRFRLDQEFPPGRPNFLVEVGGVVTRFELTPQGSPASGYEVELALAPLAVALRLEDAAGRPAQGTVVLEPRNLAPRDGLLHVSARGVRVDGAARLEHLLPGQYLLTAVVDGLRLQQTLALPGTEELVLRAPPSAALEVEALGPGGQPLAQGHLVLDVPDGLERGLDPRAASVKVTGQVLRFERLPAGRLALSLQSSRVGWQVRTWAREELVLAPGEARRLVLQAAPEPAEAR